MKAVQTKLKHISGLELLVLMVLVARALRALPPLLAAIVLCLRQLLRFCGGAFRRIARWRDRHWRRPRYSLRCDLAELEPGTCPVCLAPLAGGAGSGSDGELEAGESADAGTGGTSAPSRRGIAPSAPGEEGAGGGSQAVEACTAARPAAVGSPTSSLFRLRCGHTFHADCLNGWLDRGGTCPLCRADVGDLREWVELLGLNMLSASSRPAREVAAVAGPALPRWWPAQSAARPRRSSRLRARAAPAAAGAASLEAAAAEPMLASARAAAGAEGQEAAEGSAASRAEGEEEEVALGALAEGGHLIACAA